jgi:hypothetical protein
MTTLTITAKGQITLKQELLRHLHALPGQKIEAEMLPNGRLMLRMATQSGTIADFSGCLAKKGTPRLTIAQIKKITEEAWAGKR